MLDAVSTKSMAVNLWLILPNHVQLFKGLHKMTLMRNPIAMRYGVTVCLWVECRCDCVPSLLTCVVYFWQLDDKENLENAFGWDTA